MNKKLLLATMSLAVLAACTDNDFQSQNKNVAEEISPIQFELINGDGDATRASWNDASAAISFSATDGDLFTLYHGGTCAAEDAPLTLFENAIYTAQPGTPATLSTPSMIKAGKAIMVWPADTTFNSSDFTGGKFQITIPAAQTDFVNQLPYVSDLITIGDYTGTKHKPADYNTAGYDRKYPIFMRQMGSLLTLKADYAGTDAELAKLYEGGAEAGDDPIKPIELTGVTLSTKATGATKFTKQIPVIFTAANANWPAAATLNHKWTYVTSFDKANIDAADQTATLSAKEKSLLPGNQGAKIIILPSKSDADIDEAAVIVETYYGKVVVAANGVAGSKYDDATEYVDAWSRYLTNPATKTGDETETTVKDADGKTKVTSNIVKGMTQTINWFSSADRKSTNATVKNEPVGGNLTRYVKVLLKHLDMSELHVKSDKQLRDVVRVWKKMNLPAVTVYLDGGKEGDAEGEFTISQKTIETINTINNGTLKFQVKPCNVDGEKCNTIVVTGASTNAEVQNIAFITYNDVDASGTFTAGDVQAKVVLANETTAWQWKGTVKVQADGVAQIINKGIMTNAAAAATLKTAENDGTQNNVPLVNDGTWNITAGDLTVQFDVTNNGTVNIKKGAEYHQDIIAPATATTFTNEALTLPGRFLANPQNEKIGLVNNAGVFAVTGTTAKKGIINNYGLIEHGKYPGDAYNKDAKTYITANQMGVGAGNPTFANAFDAETEVTPAINKLGRINLPYSNKDEDNISVSAALSTGFVSVTVASGDAPEDKKLNLTVVGDKVNYVIIKGGIETVTEMTDKIKYIEFDDENDTEIAWQAGTSLDPVTATYDGLIVLSPVNIKLYTTVNVVKAAYLGAKMYVGGTLKYNGGDIAEALWSGYYGDTKANVPSMYITY